MAYERMMIMSKCKYPGKQYHDCISDCGECIEPISGAYLCPSCEDEINPRERDGFYECNGCGYCGSVYDPEYMKG